MKFKKVLSSLLAATMLFGSVTANAVTIESDDTPKRSGAAVEASGEAAINKDEYDMCDNIEDGAILHAWCWSCATITANMKDIAEAGYTAVQTSPMQRSYSRYKDKETLMGLNPNTGAEIDDGSEGAWWWQYQPTDQKLGNYQFFTNPDNYQSCCDEYSLMCSTAHAYGVKIITDVVTNHTTPHYKLNGSVEDPSLGLDISSGLLAIDDLFHTGTPKGVDGKVLSNPDNLTIGFYDRKAFGSDYTRQHLINYMNGGLPDINTENHAYQAYVVKYLNGLVELGCDGFRFDTAHRIGITGADGTNYNYGEKETTYDYWEAVTGKATVNGEKLGKLDNGTEVDPNSLFIYGEMLKHQYDSYYNDYLRITDDTYGQTLRNSIHNGSITKNSAQVQSSSLKGYSVTWVESHDDYCNSHDSEILTEKDIKFSWAILTARNVGTPLFFNRPNGSDALHGNYWGNNKIGVVGNDQFKDPEIAAVNHFRNAMVGESEYLRNIGTNNKAIQIDRGDRGSCIVNLNNSELQLTGLSTNMADGNYVDTVTGAIINVSNGQFTGGYVSKESIACIYCPIKFGVDSDTSYFSDDSCTVTTTLDKSIASGTYTVTIDGEILESGSFKDNSEITIGKGVDVGSTSKEIVLTLKVVYPRNNNVVLTEKYSYVKYSSKDITYVYYDPVAHPSWGDNIYVYIYKDDGKGGVIENAAWPGALLSDDTESGLKKYEVPYELKYGNVIFNNNNDKQYPGKDSSDTLPLEGISKTHTSGKWEAYLEPDYSYVYFFNSMGWKDDINAYLWDGGTNNNWPGEKWISARNFTVII